MSKVETRLKVARGPPGKRCYAIGDIHGRLDLLHDLVNQIERHSEQRAPRQTAIVLLGDLVDRGPNSNGVLEFCRTFRPRAGRLFVLAGNHEELLLRSIDGDLDAYQTWLAAGGAETARSYGVAAERLISADLEASRKHVADAIPQSHVSFLRSCADSIRFGDYLFVHAGIRPGAPLHSQKPNDLRWIRKSFLNSDVDHGFIVVHGHSQFVDVEIRPNRIGIDTGAYRSGVLTAMWVEDGERGFLQATSDVMDTSDNDLFE